MWFLKHSQLVALMALFVLAACQSPASAPDTRPNFGSETKAKQAVSDPAQLSKLHVLMLGPGAWSYFGDPRSISHGRLVFTGWIDINGNVMVDKTNPVTGQQTRRTLYRHLGQDDHNNPSLAWWHGRLLVFFSRHSGAYLARGARMHYLIAKKRYSITGGFSPARVVPANVAGRMGSTYPNPMVVGGVLYLMTRGGGWQPTITSTRDLKHWSKAREIMRGPYRADKPQRPYAKYAVGPDDSIHMIVSDAHVQSFNNSLYYVRIKDGRLYKADGSLVGKLKDLPLERSQLDKVYSYSSKGGRAWPHDVAIGPDGEPVVVYTRRIGGRSGVDWFRYARWDGQKWLDYSIVSAGNPVRSSAFRSGGITLDHEDVANVVLSRANKRGWNQVELWRTPDRGASWRVAPITSGRRGRHNIRPVFPRGYHQAGRLAVVFLDADLAHTYTDYSSSVRMWVGTPAHVP